MPSPILFFIFIIVVDLLLKSARDKKKIEESKRKKIPQEERQPQQQKQQRKPGPFADLRRILEEEIQKERQKELEQRNTYRKDIQTPKVDKRPEINYDVQALAKETEKKRIYEKDEFPTKKDQIGHMDFRDSIVKGIIFSEILSEPKGVKNQRRSL
ncbi:MAG: hypothetical protein M0Q14_01125 [Tissierellaceae bacterium]|nr:hypothetical protein [Tissierellaceae bacterium]